MRTIMAAGAILALAACGMESAARSATSAPTIAASARPSPLGRALHLGRAEPPSPQPDPEWTEATMAALNAEGVTLLSSMPSDVLQYCPGYASATRENRAAFWAGLIGSIAGDGPGKAEGAGKAPGLVQITNPLARAHGCSGSMLSEGDRLRCAVRILDRSVARDNAIAAPDSAGKRGWLGAARDWLPLRSARKRADIAGFTRSQRYCR